MGRPALRVLVVCVVALASALGVSELALRATIHPPLEPDEHPFLHAPLARLRVEITRALPGIGPRRVVFTSNAIGLRGDEIDLARDARAVRVLTLGDSVTECMLLSNEEAWPHRLQEALAAGSRQQVWVGNAGRSGEMLPDHLTHVRVLVPAIRPDLLILMPGGYELQAAVEEKLVPLDLDDPSTLASHVARLYTDVNLDALRTSYLGFVLQRRMETQVLDMTDFYARMKRRRYESPKLEEVPDLEDALDVYGAGLDALIRTWRALPDRPALLLVTRPFLWKPDLDVAEEKALWGGYSCMDCPNPEYYAHGALARGLRRFNEALLERCRAEDLNCVDLDAIMEKSLDNFYDDAHMTAHGARTTARILADFILRKGLLD